MTPACCGDTHALDFPFRRSAVSSNASPGPAASSGSSRRTSCARPGSSPRASSHDHLLLLSRHKWSWEELRGLLPGLAQEVLRDDPDDPIGPGLAFDETADLRKGRDTACVSPQHAGVTGKVENCVSAP